MTEEHKPLHPDIGGLTLPGAVSHRSDRWLVYAFLFLQICMAVFIVYTSYEQGNAERARDDTLAARERADIQRADLTRIANEQNKIIVCLAVDTQSFNLALADAILASPPPPAIEKEYQRLAETRERLRAGDKLTRERPPDCEY